MMLLVTFKLQLVALAIAKFSDSSSYWLLVYAYNVFSNSHNLNMII